MMCANSTGQPDESTLAADASAPQEAPIPAHAAHSLTGGGPTAHILLDGQIYTLRITRGGKLILTK
ncbi:MAG: hemin uptake protein HemP [Roseinatronobacter sp.]|jgi:hemin uptake protein HemP|nr:hemin uptake protein HemP [Roseinatronobacter sp.]